LEYEFLSWSDIESAIDYLTAFIADLDFHMYVTIARGGLVPTCLLAERVNKPIYVVNKEDSHIPRSVQKKKVVVVDDVLDTGETLCQLCKKLENVVAVITLYRKASTPYDVPNHIYFEDVPKDVWLVFPWE